MKKKKLSMPVKTMIGLAFGVAAGLALQNHAELAKAYIGPFGTLFLNCIKMIVVPMVIFIDHCWCMCDWRCRKRLEESVEKRCFISCVQQPVRQMHRLPIES